ncbi:hypothetical protein V5O48_007918 [Marasmius crinis-equi]|uniref:Uncharacterized protein n=1 Tax=Marasmius crinis-equi TaxID=585013 RepID=A0ABR3FFE8_9AGAR
MDTSLCTLPKDTLLDIDHTFWLRPWEDTFYLLYLNGEIFIVQGPPGGSWIDDDACIVWNDRVREKHLKEIMRRVDTLRPKRYKWYLLRQDEKTKEYQLMPKKSTSTLYKIKPPLWLRRVQESELQFIRWYGQGRCHCVLDDQQLDVDIAWDPVAFKKMEQMLARLQHLSEADLIYKPVAHVMRGDDVIGVAFETGFGYGRPIQYTDRRLFYQTMSEVHDRNRHCRLYKHALLEQDFHIHDGKLRITDSLWAFDVFDGPSTKMEDAIEEVTRKRTERMFDRLKKGWYAGWDTYWNPPPLLLRCFWSRGEESLRNPVSLHKVDSLQFAPIRDTSHAPRTSKGVIRPEHLLLPPGGGSSSSTRPPSAASRKAPSSFASVFTVKRHRFNPPVLSSRRIVEIKDDDIETVNPDSSDDDETLVDETDSVTAGRCPRSVSTIRSL